MYESRNGDSFLRVDDDCVPVLKSDSLLPNDITISFWFQFPAYDFLLSEFARLSSTHTHTRTHTHTHAHTHAHSHTQVLTPGLCPLVSAAAYGAPVLEIKAGNRVLSVSCS